MLSMQYHGPPVSVLLLKCDTEIFQILSSNLGCAFFFIPPRGFPTNFLGCTITSIHLSLREAHNLSSSVFDQSCQPPAINSFSFQLTGFQGFEALQFSFLRPKTKDRPQIRGVDVRQHPKHISWIWPKYDCVITVCLYNMCEYMEVWFWVLGINDLIWDC